MMTRHGQRCIQASSNCVSANRTCREGRTESCTHLEAECDQAGLKGCIAIPIYDPQAQQVFVVLFLAAFPLEDPSLISKCWNITRNLKTSSWVCPNIPDRELLKNFESSGMCIPLPLTKDSLNASSPLLARTESCYVALSLAPPNPRTNPAVFHSKGWVKCQAALRNPPSQRSKSECEEISERTCGDQSFEVTTCDCSEVHEEAGVVNASDSELQTSVQVFTETVSPLTYLERETDGKEESTWRGETQQNSLPSRLTARGSWTKVSARSAGGRERGEGRERYWRGQGRLRALMIVGSSQMQDSLKM
eukprot:747588-Hanusia_phi.AAC.4